MSMLFARLLDHAIHKEVVDIAIDSGKHGCGVSSFWNNVLADARYVPKKSGPLTANGPDATISVLFEAAFGILEYVVTSPVFRRRRIGRVIIERPRVYETKRQKGRQEDITELSIVAGAIGFALVPVATSVEFVYPSEWKGQQPKRVTENIVKKVLSDEEYGRIVSTREDLKHNVIDAVGIGLNRIAGRT